MAEEAEEADKAAEQISHIQPPTPNATVQNIHSLISNVSPSVDPTTTERSSLDSTDNVTEGDQETGTDSDEDEPEICDLLEEQISEAVGGYKLTPRLNRGVPPKRYSPDIHTKARYSKAFLAKNHL